MLILSSLTLIPVSVYLTTPTAHALIPFTSYQDIQAFIHTSGCSSSTRMLYNRGALTTGPTTSVFGANSNSASSQSPTHSETNQQVSGVDELDNVKNDGQYIYTITNNTVAIVKPIRQQIPDFSPESMLAGLCKEYLWSATGLSS